METGFKAMMETEPKTGMETGMEAGKLPGCRLGFRRTGRSRAGSWHLLMTKGDESGPDNNDKRRQGVISDGKRRSEFKHNREHTATI